MCGMWSTPDSTVSVVAGIQRRNACACAIGVMVSSSPQISASAGAFVSATAVIGSGASTTLCVPSLMRRA